MCDGGGYECAMAEDTGARWWKIREGLRWRKIREGLQGGLFADDGGDELPLSAVVAVFAEIDSLPGAEVEVAFGDGDGDAHAAQDGLGVGGHVVGAFEGVLIAGQVFGHEAIEDGLHIDSHIGVTVLVDGKSATGVFGEEVEDACLRQSR